MTFRVSGTQLTNGLDDLEVVDAGLVLGVVFVVGGRVLVDGLRGRVQTVRALLSIPQLAVGHNSGALRGQFH